MMSTEEPIDDAARLPFDLEKELASVVAGISASEPHDAERETSRALVCTIAHPKVAADEIKIDQTDRAWLSAPEREGFAIRAGLVASGLIAASGLAWIVVGSFVEPSGRVSASSEPAAQNANPSPSIFDPAKAGRLQSSGGEPGTRERSEGAKPEPGPKLSGSVPDSSRKGVVASAPATVSSTSKRSPVAQQHTALVASRAAEPPSPPRLAPVPETRPVTIEGWTVREVLNGMAVLEGPNGVWRAAAGSTVPTLGRVESVVRWGNRWIVATSSGLVSTP
jgi:hypothetical protein